MGSKVPADPNLSKEMARFLDDRAREGDSLGTRVTTLEAAALTKASTAEAQAGVEDTHYMTAAKTKDAITAQVTTPAFTKSFASSQQTITSAGALTLAHSLGTTPTLVQVSLVCQTGEFGYTAGDILVISLEQLTTSHGVSVVVDATNLNVRYGGNANVFNILNKTTGVAAVITLANWRAVFRCWA